MNPDKVPPTPPPDPILDLTNHIYNTNCITGMKAKMPDKIVDLIIADPPFAINFKAEKPNYNRKESNVIPGYHDIHPEDYDQFTKDWITQCHRILKDDGSIYIVSGHSHLDVILSILLSSQFNFHLQNIIGWKFQFGLVTRRKYVTSHYNIIFATKHKTKYNFYPNCRFSDDDKLTVNGKQKGSARYRDMEDIWIINKEYKTGNKRTPTNLPSELIKKIIGYSSKEGDLVFDPFMGSGQTAVSAKEMNRDYLGFEIVPNYYDFIMERLKEDKGNNVV